MQSGVKSDRKYIEMLGLEILKCSGPFNWQAMLHIELKGM
jgi:hypothetical protein